MALPSNTALDRERPPLLTSTSVMFVAKLAAALFSLVNVLIVSRALGPSGRGTVVFLMTVAILSSQVATLSISESASNIAGRSPHRRGAVAGNALAFSLLLGLLTAGVLAALMAGFTGFASFGSGVDTWLRALTLVSVPLLILLDYLQRLVLADYGFTTANVSITLPVLANTVVNGLLYATGTLTVGTAFVVWLAGQLATVLVLAWYVYRRLAGFGRPDRKLAREMLTFGLKSHGSRIMMWGNYRLDQWLVGAMAGSTELGLYSVAVAWAEGLFLLPTALGQVQRPDLVRAGRRAAGAQAARAFRIVVLVTAVLAIGLVLLAPFLCVTVFGPDFRGSIDDLRILAVSAFGIVALKIFGNALIAQGKPLLEAAASLIAFAITVGLDLLLIPRHGGAGAALASASAYTAGGLAVAIIAARTLGFSFWSAVPGSRDFGDAGALLRQAASHLRPGRAAPLVPGDQR